jgi:hypothetical protein
VVDPPPPPVIPISAVTELVSSIVSLVHNKRSAPEEAPQPPAPKAMPVLPPELPRAASAAVKILPPPQVLLGQPPVFSQTVDAARSPYFGALAPEAADRTTAAAAVAGPPVLASVMLPRVGVDTATVQKRPASSSRSSSPGTGSSAGPKYLSPTESWLSKGPELQGVHLHLRKVSAKPPNASGSVFTKDRVSDFNFRAREHLRLHKTRQ